MPKKSICPYGETAPNGPGPSHYQGFTITLRQTHNTQ